VSIAAMHRNSTFSSMFGVCFEPFTAVLVWSINVNNATISLTFIGECGVVCCCGQLSVVWTPRTTRCRRPRRWNAAHETNILH